MNNIETLTNTFTDLIENAAAVGLTINAVTVEANNKHYSINPYEDTVVEVNADGTRIPEAEEYDIQEFYQLHPALLED
ncbi:TPA: hypothetical protein ACXLOS_002896 [Salmonella enterica]|uniref:hypothetical protein n=1 Tax=Citrobacter sp. Cpo012 TaxID=2985120 RepID=UPI000D5A072D|nr:hypothetical protein [Citrobacter sp. Cpo012]EDF9497061.1 hypothetical protein [Salmonella enterica]MDM2910096.1 hypothetical protein [Citrobacter sp. Cpo012]